MIGSRRIFTTLLATLLAASLGHAGIFNRKSRADAQKAQALIEALHKDASNARRAEAARELAEYDPKGNMDVLSALIGALQRDNADTVRAEAANALAQIKPYSAQAGLALERAADADRSEEVRTAAREALWEYHLNGYRSQRLAERIMYQTAEPPLTKHATVRPVTALAPLIVIAEPIRPRVPVVVPRLPPAPVPYTSLPPLVQPPGLVGTPEASPTEPRLQFRPDLPFNRTEEPPLAHRRAPWLSPASTSP